MTGPVRPPIKPMLAKLREEIPRGGGWLYEPKWDGFRTIVYFDGDEIDLRSRNDRPMLRYFPEIADPLREALVGPAVVDGEIVMPSEDGLAFDALQMRLHPAKSRVDLLAEQTPVNFVGFDVLAIGDEDLRRTPFDERAARLDAMLPVSDPASAPATMRGPLVFDTPRTSDADLAARWFDELERVHLDGIIAKQADLHYQAGDRVMVKIKHRRTADCVVGGYRVHKHGGVGSLLLGLYEDGRFHFVGHTASFKAAERRELEELLEPLRNEASFEGEWGPGGESRWSAGKDQSWVSVQPTLVCEVSYDYIQSGYRFRHAATFLRWRDDKRPEDCTFDQVRP